MFSINEIIDIIVMTFAIGYIFSTFIRRQPHEEYDPISYYKKTSLLEDIKFGIIIAAPAVVLHEMAHKFTAMAFGARAILSAPDLYGIPYGWYILVILLRYLNFPLFFFVGGYVAHTPLPPLQSAIVSISGPLLNLTLYLIFTGLIKYKAIHRKYYNIIGISAKLNLFLCVFNLIPLPGFDGFNFLLNVFRFF